MIYKHTGTYPRIYGLGAKESFTRWLLALQKLTTKVWYQLVSVQADQNLTFMNFGYAPAEADRSEPELDPADGRNRNTIQLYRRVTAAVDLRGKDVLEVGCGRGGGAAYIQKYLTPRSMTGIDFCGKAVAFCVRQHGGKGISFARGDADALDFPPETFDVVVNVESCHCYLSVERFLAGVFRVLRQGGNFLIADMGPKPYIEALREELGRSGLSMVEEEDITACVVRALQLTTEKNATEIRAQVPRGVRSLFSNFAGIEGTPVFEALRRREWEYVRFVMRKI